MSQLALTFLACLRRGQHRRRENLGEKAGVNRVGPLLEGITLYAENVTSRNVLGETEVAR